MVATMIWQRTTGRDGGWPRPTTVVHGGVIGALMAGVAAAWATLALTAAVLVMPIETMQLIERQGAWGIGGVLRQGSAVLVTALVPGRQVGR